MTSGHSCVLLLSWGSAAISREPQQREGPVGSSVVGRWWEVVPATPLPTAGPRPAWGPMEERQANSSASRRKPHPARWLGALGLTPCTSGVSASRPLLASPKTEPGARQPGTSHPNSPVSLQPRWSEMHLVQMPQTCPSPKAVALRHGKAAFSNQPGGAGDPRTATVLTMTSSPSIHAVSLHSGPVAPWLSPRHTRLVLSWGLCTCCSISLECCPPLTSAWRCLPFPWCLLTLAFDRLC